MSILMEVLKEELDRLERQQAVYERDLQAIPKGYISKKKISGKEYCYLQYRDGRRVVSQYIAAEDLPKVEFQVKRRRQLEASLRRVREDQIKLRKVVL